MNEEGTVAAAASGAVGDYGKLKEMEIRAYCL